MAKQPKRISGYYITEKHVDGGAASGICDEKERPITILEIARKLNRTQKLANDRLEQIVAMGVELKETQTVAYDSTAKLSQVMQELDFIRSRFTEEEAFAHALAGKVDELEEGLKTERESHWHTLGLLGLRTKEIEALKAVVVKLEKEHRQPVTKAGGSDA